VQDLESSAVLNNRIILVLAVTAVAAPAQTVKGPMLKETITEGKQFAHYLELPSGFNIGRTKLTGVLMSHYGFRVSINPDVLLVSGCEYKDLEEICSLISFAIDTSHGYSIRQSTQSEWQNAKPFKEAGEMNDPVHRFLREEVAKPPALRTIPIETAAPSHQLVGYSYLGKKYLRRGEWVTTAINFGHSADQNLMILTGADDRAFAFPKSLLRAESNLYGRFSVDIFDRSPDHRIAAMDIDCIISVIDSLSHVSLINSRWVAIGLDPELKRMLLFDFGDTAKREIQ
jgi:hypothetical protein